jgi:hypothetical protein
MYPVKLSIARGMSIFKRRISDNQLVLQYHGLCDPDVLVIQRINQGGSGYLPHFHTGIMNGCQAGLNHSGDNDIVEPHHLNIFRPLRPDHGARILGDFHQ